MTADPLAGVSPQTSQEANSAKNAEVRGRERSLVLDLVIEGNGHTYSCEKNPRNMPEWRVACFGCGIPFGTPIQSDWPEGEYVCEACDG